MMVLSAENIMQAKNRGFSCANHARRCSHKWAYKLIPASGSGTSGVNYDETDFGYDVMKRQNRVVTPGGTITRTVFDVRDNPVGIFIGTDDAGATDSDPTGGGTPGNNMTQVTGNQYDNGLAGGDNNLTQQTQYVDSVTQRVTAFLYDWRDRRTDTDGEIDFYQKQYYDNLDRIIRSERYNTGLSGNLVSRQVTNWDDLGRVYQRLQYGVDPATGLVGNAIADNSWYDASGNVIKQQPAGAQFFTKMTYDGINRPLVQYLGYDLGETTYAQAQDVSDDTILEQVENTYDEASSLILVATRRRYHNTSGVGPLGTPTSAAPLARVSYLANWPDPLGRIQATADYGTNGGSPLVRPAVAPPPSDTVLVSSKVFDSAGNVQTTTDAAGLIVCLSYDAVGREVQRQLNCSSSSSSSSRTGGGCPASADTNITIQTTYNGDGNVSSITVLNAATGSQVTQYIYGTTLADSGIASSLLKAYEILPDSAGGSDQVQYQYNRQGEVIILTDPAGTVHNYDYDLLGRRSQDRATTLGTGVDTAIRRIETDYEVRGMPVTLTSYSNATVGMGSIVNQVQLSYDSFGQLASDAQSHSGKVISSTPGVQYSYGNGSGNTTRLLSITYPNGRVLNCNYGVAGGMGDALSRVASLIDSDGVAHLADYAYLGRETVVVQTSVQPGLQYTLVGIAGGNDPDTGDIYRGLDRFSRIKDLVWTAGNSSSSSSSSSSGAANIIERIQHGYNRAGSRLYRAELADPLEQHDESYLYDGMQRLKEMQRGTLNTGKTGIAALTFEQCWSLDETGNWKAFQQDSSGNGTWDQAQTRTANPVNEITAITVSAGGSWIKPLYNAAGNMTTLPQPATPSSSYIGKYDAWNRLVKLTAAGKTVAQYKYDGLKRRLVKERYTAGVLSETRHIYYSASWQVLEERVGTATSSANRQFVWGVRYLDDLLLRDRDAAGGGTLSERLYAVQDDNWNVTAAVDTTGTVQERYGYTAYGMPSVMSASFGSRSTSLFDWETLYAGYRWDSESGLYQVRNRAYGPHLGNWLQRDPVGLAGGYNLYLYAANDGINKADPNGLFNPVVAGCIGGLLGGGIASVISYLRGTYTFCEAFFNALCYTGMGCLMGALVTSVVIGSSLRAFFACAGLGAIVGAIRAIASKCRGIIRLTG